MLQYHLIRGLIVGILDKYRVSKEDAEVVLLHYDKLKPLIKRGK